MAAKFSTTAPVIPVLLKHSAAKTWSNAKAEWRLNHIYFVDSEEAETCACGHYPICEICVIENDVTDTVIEVGNCCINQISPEFEQLRRIFPALKKRRLNPAVINYAATRTIINEWEAGFLADVWRKRLLTKKQSIKLDSIKNKIFNSVMSPARRRQNV